MAFTLYFLMSAKTGEYIGPSPILYNSSVIALTGFFAFTVVKDALKEESKNSL